MERDGENLIYEGVTVLPVATCEDLMLDGVYVQPSALESPYPPNWIAFASNGEFLDSELIGDLAYQNIVMPNPKTISGGRGKYKIGRNTLFLKYHDGRNVQVEMHAQTEDLKSSEVPRIYINGIALLRVE